MRGEKINVPHADHHAPDRGIVLYLCLHVHLRILPTCTDHVHGSEIRNGKEEGGSSLVLLLLLLLVVGAGVGYYFFLQKQQTAMTGKRMV